MTRTVVISKIGKDKVEKKIFRGKNVKEILRKVEVAFPEISNWEEEHYPYRPGVYVRGESGMKKVKGEICTD